MTNKDLNKLAQDFIQATLGSSGVNTSSVTETIEKLAGLKEKADFDIAVGQIIMQNHSLALEEIQELSQEVYSYRQEHPHFLGYYVPGVLLLQMHGAALSTVLDIWEKEQVANQ